VPSASRLNPEGFGGRNLGRFAEFMWRVVLAGVAAAVVVGLASVGMLFSTAPEWLSLIFEPLSLLFLPGLLVDMVQVGPHDLAPAVVVQASVAIYFVLFLGALEWRARRQRRRGVVDGFKSG
jgi:hypothetical protein